MKRTKFFAGLIAIIFIPVFYFTACNQKDEVNSPNQASFDSPIYSVIDNVDIQNGLEDATLDKDFGFNDQLLSYSFLDAGMSFNPSNPMMKGNPWLEKFDFTKHLGWIFRQLKLTDEQRTQVKGFMVTFHDSAKVQIKKFFVANRVIIDSANVQRRAIVKDFKAGNITKEQAQTKLKDLNQKTRALIDANPVSVTVKQTLCDLRTHLFQNIKSLLDTNQSSKWDKMISRLKNPC